MPSILAAADDTTNGSLSQRLRARRFEVFASLAARLPRPIRVLDIGGMESIWANCGWTDLPGVSITLANLVEVRTRAANVRSVIADATDLAEFDDGSFDIAFSNSVIEHLFTFEAQRAMAREVQRVGRAHWVQTPNYWFPMEPHFHVPGWQWLPRDVRVGALQRFRCGQRGRCAERAKAERIVDEVRLMTRAEMAMCFPGSTIWRERLGGMTKSWVAYGGFPPRYPSA